MVEEAAQEIFLKAFTQLASYEGRGSMEGWLTRIATNTCLNMLRSAKRRPELSLADLTEDQSHWLDTNSETAGDELQTVEDKLVASDLADKLLDTLPAEDQVALLMMDGENASVKEVAEATGGLSRK
jgi:RNA polymerase sigma factor (sigma-70 family)